MIHLIHMTPHPMSCLTCGSPVPAPARAWDDDGEPVMPSSYCSIHCEHYHGLQRASAAPHESLS